MPAIEKYVHAFHKRERKYVLREICADCCVYVTTNLVAFPGIEAGPKNTFPVGQKIVLHRADNKK